MDTENVQYRNRNRTVSTSRNYLARQNSFVRRSKDDKNVELEKIVKELKRISRVQEADGGFFESFSALSWKQENRKLQAIREDEAEKGKAPPTEASVGIEGPACRITKREWQQLYVGVLYSVHNQIGVSPREIVPVIDDYYKYAQTAFGVNDDDHDKFMILAQQEKPPILVLNVTVVEAQGLEAKDPDGFSDPFCMLGIQPCGYQETRRLSSREFPEPERENLENHEDETKLTRKHHHSFKLSFKKKDGRKEKEHRERGGFADGLSNDIPAKYISATSVKRHTLNPQWDEKFKFDIDDRNGDRLHLDIWDNDDESSVIDAVRKLNQVQSWKGLGRYFKQIAQSARSQDAYSCDDFLGCVNISLQDIPSTGVDQWCELQGRSHRSNVQGRIRLRLSLSTRNAPGVEQDHWWDVRDHEHILHVFIDYELSKLKDEAYRWTGELSSCARQIVHQHAIQSDLTRLQQGVCKWRAYSQKHMQQSFDYVFLYKLLQEINEAWGIDSLSQDEEYSLSESFCQFIEYSLTILRRQRDLFPVGNVAAHYKLEYLLRCLALINDMQAYWRCCPFSKAMHMEITNTIKKGVVEWYDTVFAQTRPKVKNDDTLLQSYVDLVNTLNVDLYKNLKYHTKLFESIVAVNYFALCYKEIDKMVTDDVKEIAVQQCEKLKNLTDLSADLTEDSLTIGTLMFEFYMSLQEMSAFKQHLPANDRRSLYLTGFQDWFVGAVLKWLSIARYKLMLRIRRAVQLDKASQIDSNLKLSTSSVDTTSCFYQIKEFWKQLAWPDYVSAYSFVFKVFDDITNGAMYYADLMQQRLIDAGYYDIEGQFDVTEKLCLSINNIEHVRCSLKPLPKELNVEEIFLALAKAEDEYRSVQCRKTLQTMLNSADDDMVMKIVNVVRHVAQKMNPDIKTHVFHLAWAPDRLPTDDAITPLIEYLDNNLSTLNDTLLHLNFERILEAIWEVLLQEMSVQAESGIGKNQPIFFARLHEALNILVEFFHANHKGLAIEKLHSKSFYDFEKVLDLHMCESDTLISRYCIQQQVEQEKADNKEFGVLNVKAYFRHDCLCIDVLNAKNLIALDPNGFSDPFVIIELLPSHVFGNSITQQTKVVKKSLHPYFDECFEYTVHLEQCSNEASMVLFTVMDHDIMLSNDFAGVACLKMSNIAGVQSKVASADINNIKPVELILRRPKYKDDVILTTLEKRTWDKVAQEFVKRRKAHMI